MKPIISQLDYPHIVFPGTKYRWDLYGCLCSCLCMLLGKTVEEFVKENPTGWTADGNLKTDAVLAKYGYKLVREPIAEGAPIPLAPYRRIARTSFLSPKYPTHFYIIEADSTGIIDPGSRFNPKTENRYVKRTNELRYLVPITPQCKDCPIHCKHA